jgi:hypothetical protein
MIATFRMLSFEIGTDVSSKISTVCALSTRDFRRLNLLEEQLTGRPVHFPQAGHRRGIVTQTWTNTDEHGQGAMVPAIGQPMLVRVYPCSSVFGPPDNRLHEPRAPSARIRSPPLRTSTAPLTGIVIVLSGLRRRIGNAMLLINLISIQKRVINKYSRSLAD